MKTAFVTVLVLLLIPMAAQATTVRFGFYSINSDNVYTAADTIGAAQFFVDVTDTDPNLVSNQVLFRFLNIGSEASSICDVYFDDGTLLSIAGLVDADDGVGGDSDVDFSRLADPSELPGRNNIIPAFETTESFSADSDPSVQPNGVNPGESLGIYFDLESGGTYDDVLAELGSGVLRIGIRGQGFPNDESESFVNRPPEPIPEPGTLVLLGTGLVGVVSMGARRRKKG